MDEDFNPDPVSDNPEGASGDRLVSALEELILGRWSLRGARLSDPVESVESVDQGMHQGTERALPRFATWPCPEPPEWALLLGEDAGSAEMARASSLLAHAADCRPCAERLREFSADLSAEETAALATLTCASAEGQSKLAAELARTPRPFGSRRFTRLYLWAGAGLAASLLISAGIVSWLRLENNPERLMAEAYTHSRTFDLRMPGAGYAEVTPEIHLRGGAVDREPAKLHEARARIERNLEAAPEDTHWLQMEARSDVLEEKFDSAIDILDRQVAAGPVTASLLLDDASAYFQRGVATGSESDRATALDYLRRADELAPGDTVVLFNEAVTMEDRGQLINAVETWNRYLRLERDPSWQVEGRRRLQALEQKLNELKSHHSRLEQHLAIPMAVLALA